jgi:hypothetical protein
VESRSALESVVPHDAPVAQLDRACASEAQGRVFESLRAHHFQGSLFSATSVDTLHFVSNSRPRADLLLLSRSRPPTGYNCPDGDAIAASRREQVCKL